MVGAAAAPEVETWKSLCGQQNDTIAKLRTECVRLSSDVHFIRNLFDEAQKLERGGEIGRAHV